MPIRCLVTGATGYVGGRLVPRLLADGHRVRILVRDPARVRDHPWAGAVEVATGDVLDAGATQRALADCDVGYYLVHALGTGPQFADRDRQAAATFAAAARDAGVRRIVYLGGLHPPGALSPHLASRAEVGDLLLASGVPTAVLQAAVILGSGSASFEMLRYLTERLPAMVTPRWVGTRIQPIAIRDVLHYLAGCANLPPEVNRSFDIGGPDVLTYGQMIQRYATIAGLPRRLIIPVPVLTPRLSGLWVQVVTPIPNALARPLVESLRHEVVCREHDIARWIPDPLGGLLGFDDAVRLALRRVRDEDVATRWSSAALPNAPSDPLPTDATWAGGSRYQDVRTADVAAPADVLWRLVESIGGAAGWYSWPLAWRVRGGVDRLLGGVGLRRGRRDPHRLRVGDALDFWRVEEVQPGRLLVLRAEMRLPGRAWLEISVSADGPELSRYRQRAVFLPRGLAGHLYWWAVAPFHVIVFGGMARRIARAARAAAAVPVARATPAPPAAPAPPSGRSA